MERINHHLVMIDRETAVREASPTLAIVDAQSGKCDAPQGERGFDAAKKIMGRKRHLPVDSDGRLLAGRITPADIQDQDGDLLLAQRLLLRPEGRGPALEPAAEQQRVDAVD
jgi:putative transposase